MSISQQCLTLGVPKSSFYFKPKKSTSVTDEIVMQLIDRIYLEEPTYGKRRIRQELKNLGYNISLERTRKLMGIMNIRAIYPEPRLSQPGEGHKIYPYLLRNLEITQSDHVWCTDITYIPLGTGHVYLIAVMDWSSRYIIDWKLSNSMDKSFCIECLESALAKGSKPKIFNTDQGSQFTSHEFTQVLKDHDVKISMDGKGRALDNVMIERFWRTIKYDDIYVKCYESMPELYQGIKKFIEKYNKRHHQGIDMTPAEAYYGQNPEQSAA